MSEAGSLLGRPSARVVEIDAGVDMNIEDVENVVEMNVDNDVVADAPSLLRLPLTLGTAVHLLPPIVVILNPDIVAQTRVGDSSRPVRRGKKEVRDSSTQTTRKGKRR